MNGMSWVPLARFGCVITGIHPRSEGLVRLTRAYELGTERVTAAALERAFREESKRLISYQWSRGFTVVMDPSLKWKDHFRPLSSLRGLEVGAGYTRWFTTNTFYKKPLVVGELGVGGNPLGASWYISMLPEGRGGVFLPGPYTFYRLCEDRFYGDPLRLMKGYASVISSLLGALDSRRLVYVQLSEPALTFEATKPRRGELEMYGEAVKVLVEGLGGGVRISVHTFFGSPAELLPFLMRLPIDYVGVDFVRTSISELEGVRFTKGLICGFVDAESSYMESVDEITAFAGEVVEALAPPEVLMAPNMDLRYLPASIAEAKLERLVEASRVLMRGSGE